MIKTKISLNDMESMESFTRTVSELDYRIYLRPEGECEETILDAKSILTVMSLVIYKRLELIALTEDNAGLMRKLKPYIAQG
jgi:phosphotransferase system HPr-like phosphotransfer protein